jgi:dTDP-4-amino-4,6-dideoxygalactose transaminase
VRRETGKDDGCKIQNNVLIYDELVAALLRSLRVHGQGTDKYDSVCIGTNARLDTIQATVLCEQLAIFPDGAERGGGALPRAPS